MPHKMVDNIKWLGHDGFRIQAGQITLAIDPFQVKQDFKADIVLISHSHYDHCSAADVAKISKPDTVIITESKSAGQLTGDIRTLRPGDTLEIKGIVIKAVWAYNIDKQFHPKSDGGLGFVIQTQGVSIYHAGDTDLIPEMEDIQADIALLPVSGTYVMTAQEAVAAAKRIGPKIAIPMHYNSIVGSDADARTFQKGLEGICDVIIPG